MSDFSAKDRPLLKELFWRRKKIPKEREVSSWWVSKTTNGIHHSTLFAVLDIFFLVCITSGKTWLTSCTKEKRTFDYFNSNYSYHLSPQAACVSDSCLQRLPCLLSKRGSVPNATTHEREILFLPPHSIFDRTPLIIRLAI